MDFSGMFKIDAVDDRLPMIRQSEIAECGIACIAMVASYYGNQQSMHNLRRQFGVNVTGVNLKDIMLFASELGLQATPYEIDMDEGDDPLISISDQIGDLDQPAILHWDANHFVVLKSLKKELNLSPGAKDFGQKVWMATIHDPAMGVVKYTLREMVKHFTGYLILCEPVADFKVQDNREKIGFRSLWTRIRGFKSALLAIVLISFVLQCIQLVTPYYLQTVLDRVLISADYDLLSVLAIGFGALMLFERAASLLRGFNLNIFNNLLSAQLRTGLYRHLLRLPQNFFESREIGDTLSRFGSLDTIQNLMVGGLVAVVLDGVMGLTVLAIMYIYSPFLTFLTMGMLSVYLLIQWISMSKNREFTEKVIRQDASLHSQQIETLRAAQTLKLFNAQTSREMKWVHGITDLTRTRVAQGNFKEWLNLAAAFVKGALHVLVIYLGAKMVLAEEFSVGMFLAFISYRTMLADSMTNLIGKFAEFKLLDVHFERVADMVCSEPEDAGDPPTSSDPVLSGKIELKNVYFHYGVGVSTKNVLNDLSLKVMPGESVAIVGPSGSGKTTVMKLMLGLTSPHSGQVLVDDVPLTAFGLRKFRAQVSTVMQDDQLLNGTIIDNIVFFEQSYDMDWAISCAKAACIYDDIMAMPMNWQSLVGDMGSLLSGGQKQRLLLARALYKKPRIIFMDEATSHLDQERESMINEAMREMSITRVIVAHRKETIASANRVIAIGQTPHV